MRANRERSELHVANYKDLLKKAEAQQKKVDDLDKRIKAIKMKGNFHTNYLEFSI
ncbi:hypothetical protein MHBO_005207 [Bonamia ostreae]|uniref:Uncharacterized protein n=1 Tax=Bonamia ostreae TaxID=126728 RepID=A0ABV2AWK0_9EUKA